MNRPAVSRFGWRPSLLLGKEAAIAAVATVGAQQPPTTQHQHHPPPVAGAAAPGQNMGGDVKKGQGTSTDQDSRA
eukprot:1153943-Pelagomonas_calceolata.AAC.2